MNSPRKEPIVCSKDTMAMSIPIILAMEASILLMKGWSGYLAYVMNHKKVSTTLEEILVARNFLEVLAEVLSELPPQCKVKFVIELETNTTPISKPPYGMAPG